MLMLETGVEICLASTTSTRLNNSYTFLIIQIIKNQITLLNAPTSMTMMSFVLPGISTHGTTFSTTM